MAGTVFGLVLGLSCLFVFGFSVLLVPMASGLPTTSLSLNWSLLVAVFVAVFVAGLVFALVYPQTWSSSLAFAQLAASDRTPVQLIRFLEDARSRGVLRTVGPVYQFRHARLQDRLAAQQGATGPEPSKPLPTAGNAATPTAEAPPATAM